jgi:aspartate racemase
VAAGETLAEMTRALVGIGAEVIAMPCNTAHVHAEAIKAAGGAPFIDMIDETVAAAQRRADGARRIGIMATPGGRTLYQARLEAAGLEAVVLSPEDEKRLMGLIFAIKAGRIDRPAMARLGEALVAAGAQAIIAGCTEVPLALADGDIAVSVIDSSQALAEACVRACIP